jgi:hypothetical protein
MSTPCLFSLKLIICLQINLVIESIFDILQLANELGVVDLQQQCVSFVTKQINPETATQLLILASRQKESVRASDPGRSIIQCCIEYVEEKAEDVVVTRGFLELPKQVVIRLVTSNKVIVKLVCLFVFRVSVCVSVCLSVCLPVCGYCLRYYSLPLRRLMCGGMLWLGQSIKLALSGI